MNKYLTILTVCVLILSACGTQNKTKNEEVETKNKLSSIRDLMRIGKEQKCTWMSEVEGDKSSGTMIIKGNKFKQTVVTNTKDEKENSVEVVTDGVWTYLWNPKTKESGMKIKVTEEQKADTQKLANGTLDLGKEFDYNCSPASISDDEFNPPKDVEFMDLEALQNQFKNLMPSGVAIPTGE